jgi:hypothetical protein
VFERWIEVINEDREARDVVHVRMRDDYVANCAPLFGIQSDGDTAGINCHTVIDQKTSQALLKGCATLGIEGAG